MKINLAILLALVLGGLPAFARQCFADPRAAYDYLVLEELRSKEVVLNINTAKADEFLSLQGVGAVTAEAIVAYRTQVGRFERVEDLLKVKGIGQKTLDKNRHRLSVHDPNQTP